MSQLWTRDSSAYMRIEFRKFVVRLKSRPSKSLAMKCAVPTVASVEYLSHDSCLRTLQVVFRAP